MTQSSEMTCEYCRELLTDLVCGELHVRDEERARAHAESCEECKKALAGFQYAIWAASEVPLDEPSDDLEKRIMAAAEAALKKAPAEVSSEPGAFGAWLAKLGDWVMSPQVAMASVLVLVVGIGLYALPLGAPKEHAALAPASAPEPAPMAEAPSATSAAVPIHESEAEARKRTKLEGARAKPAARPAKSASVGESKRDRYAPPPPAANDVAPRRASAPSDGDGLGALGKGVGGGGSGVGLGGAEREAQPAKPASEEVAARAEPTADEAREQPVAAQAPAAAAPPEAPATPAPTETLAQSDKKEKDSAPAGEKAEASAGTGAAAVAEAAPTDAAASGPSPVAAAAPAPAPKPPSERAELARGMQALSAGRLPQAITILNPLARAGSDEVRDLAQSLLAEALHDANRCKEAIQWYARITARPSASSRSLELAADCYAKTGNDAKAAELRARARK